MQSAYNVPTMQDRAMQALYLQALDPIAETLADPNSYGFRKERSCADAMDQCATVLSNGTRPQWILEGDIKSCFDKISHPWLLSHIPMDKTILNTWLKAGYMDKPSSIRRKKVRRKVVSFPPYLRIWLLTDWKRILRKKYPNSGSEP